MVVERDFTAEPEEERSYKIVRWVDTKLIHNRLRSMSYKRKPISTRLDRTKREAFFNYGQGIPQALMGLHFSFDQPYFRLWLRLNMGRTVPEILFRNKVSYHLKLTKRHNVVTIASLSK
jgi:hypothetical protein